MKDGFYYDVLRLPDGSAQRLKVRSMVGFLPLCATTIIEEQQRNHVDHVSGMAMVSGEEVRLKFFCMRSKYSGKHFVRFYPCERRQAIFDGHARTFALFDGVFPVLIYNILTTAVRKVLRGRDRLEQEEFCKFKAYYSFR